MVPRSVFLSPRSSRQERSLSFHPRSLTAAAGLEKVPLIEQNLVECVT